MRSRLEKGECSRHITKEIESELTSDECVRELRMKLIYEREAAEERGEAFSSGLTLETVDQLGRPHFDDVRVGLDGIRAEPAVPQPPPICVGITIENLKIFRGAEVLT